MPRPRKCRRVSASPGVVSFKPRGIPMRELQEIYLPHEGFEALRLTDVEGLNQSEAARLMGVSRQTYGRVLGAARRAVARAVIEGKALSVEGGDYRIETETEAVRPARDRIKGIGEMNLIAISAREGSLDSPVDPRFGRAPGFIVFDIAVKSHRYLSNAETASLPGGAGVQAVQTIADAGVQLLLTGSVGPKAMRALEAAGIQVVQGQDGLSVGEAITRFLEDRSNAAAD
ncbi:MAG: DUF134 domain-containing protein [Rhodospirillales bacterium]|nr:DUF134 domain-containing protein [Rhodospirillales bacterium]